MGEIASVREKSVRIISQSSEEKELEADIFIKCLGYTSDFNLLDGRTMVEAIFDFQSGGLVNHNISIDAVYDIFTLGATAEMNILPVISYPLYCEIFDTLALQALKSGGEVMQDRWRRIDAEQVPMERVDASHFIKCLWSILQMKQNFKTLAAVCSSLLKARSNQLRREHQQHILDDIQAELRASEESFSK